MGADYLGGQFTAACLSAGTSSFADFLRGAGRCRARSLLPGGRPAGPGAAGRRPGPGSSARTCRTGPRSSPLDFDGGVIMAGDRRSTAGNMIAQRDIEKVFRSDDFSCVGISGVAGIGLELVRLFQLELEHYEKLEGRTLSLEGKANRLATFVRGNLGARHAGPGRGPAVRRLRRGGRQGPHLQLRRGRRAVRGAPVPRHRLRLGVRPRLAEEALHRRAWPPATRSPRACRPCTTPPTTTPPPAART